MYDTAVERLGPKVHSMDPAAPEIRSSRPEDTGNRVAGLSSGRVRAVSLTVSKHDVQVMSVETLLSSSYWSSMVQ